MVASYSLALMWKDSIVVMWMDSSWTVVGCTVYKCSLAVPKTASWVSCRLPTRLSKYLVLSPSQQVTIRAWSCIQASSNHLSKSDSDTSCVKWRGILPDRIKIQMYIISTSIVLLDAQQTAQHRLERTHLSEVFECIVASAVVSSEDDVFTVPYRGFLYLEGP